VDRSLTTSLPSLYSITPVTLGNKINGAHSIPTSVPYTEILTVITSVPHPQILTV